jgi:uncharacterized protein YqhQ
MNEQDAPRAGAEACRPSKATFGGQAVIEGVMMRGRNGWGIAVRRPCGEIARASFPLPPPGSSHRVLRLPVVRGVVALYDSMSLGIKALGYSANIGLEAVEPAGSEKDSPGAVSPAATADADCPRGEAAAKTEKVPSFGWKEMTVTVLVAVAFAVGLFVVLPLAVVKYFEETFSNPFLFNFVEGIIRIAVFLIYILVISLLPDLRRVFMYHGAEHKIIHAYEHCGRPDVEEARRYRTLHPRCGTGFLLLVMVIAVLIFAIVGKPALPWLVLSRIVGIPLIIGLSYEVGIKWAGKHSDGLFARILLWPGMQLQRLTTRQPTDDQLEVAAAALEEAIRVDEAEQVAAKELAVQA